MGECEPTRVMRWKVYCKEFGHRSVSYVLTGDGYGQLLGETQSNELAKIDALSDPVFDEVVELVHQLLGRQYGTSEYFQKVLGEACDAAPSGDVYSFAGEMWCPDCGSRNVAYGPDTPPQFDVIGICPATHRHWTQLSRMAKRDLIRDALVKANCLSA